MPSSTLTMVKHDEEQPVGGLKEVSDEVSPTAAKVYRNQAKLMTRIACIGAEASAR